MKKSRFLLVLCSLMMFITIHPLEASPQISGRAAVLLDAGSGQVLLDRSKDEKLPPASTTKVLTAILAIESGKLEEMVTIGPNPSKLDGTRVYLEEGEKVKLSDLVQAALIQSANDAALAIGEYLAGSSEGFAEMMNAKAREIGAVNSNFLNPHGLSEENHYTTAYDLALIGRYALKNEIFRQIVQSKILDWEGQAWQTRLINTNNLLWSYEGAIGLKTGYTTEAKFTIVGAATRNDQTFIAVVLGSNSKQELWRDAAAVLDYGFNNFQSVQLADPASIVASVNLSEKQKLELVPDTALNVVLPKDSNKKIESQVLLQDIKAPIAEGHTVGEILFTMDGNEIGKVDLLAHNEVKRQFSLSNLILYVAAGLFFLQVLWRSILMFRRSRRRYGYGSSYRSGYRSY